MVEEDDILTRDFGNFDIPDLDIDAFDFVPDEISELESRYIKPKLKPMKKDYVLYDNALKFAKEAKIDFNERIYAMIAGSFIFGDFIEAFFTTHNVNATEMIISTLSLSQENIDSLHNLLIHGYVDKLTILVSDYFYSHERFNLVPYMYEMLGYKRFISTCSGFRSYENYSIQNCRGKKYRNSWFCEPSFFR